MFTDSFMGISSGYFLHCLLAAGLTLLVLDVFFCTEFLSWLALALFALWGTWQMALPLQWSVLVFIIFLGIGFAAYYLLWARLVRPVVMGMLLRKAPEEFDSLLSGKPGTIRGCGDNLSVRVGDQLFPVAPTCRRGLQEGDAVLIDSLDNGFAFVRKSDL